MSEVVVVGSGIAGASAPYRVARAGHTVQLIDRADLRRATDAGAGIVAPRHAQTPPTELSASRLRAPRSPREVVVYGSGW
jgi:glycine/D-amino acid oxidase-like deaminating enzyme